MNAFEAIEKLQDIYDYLDDSPDFRQDIKEIQEWIKRVST